MKELIFISTPYGNCEDKVARLKAITQYSGKLMVEGNHVICPMSMGLALAKETELPTCTEWWLSWTINLLSRCDKMIVLCFDKWDESVGVKREIDFALNNNIEVEYEYFKN